jgi:hypothetical protein
MQNVKQLSWPKAAPDMGVPGAIVKFNPPILIEPEAPAVAGVYADTLPQTLAPVGAGVKMAAEARERPLMADATFDGELSQLRQRTRVQRASVVSVFIFIPPRKEGCRFLHW